MQKVKPILLFSPSRIENNAIVMQILEAANFCYK